MKPLKILFITPYYYPATFFGGPVKIAHDIVKELAKRGHEVTVYSSDAKDLKERLASCQSCVDGAKIYYFRNLSMFFVKKSKLFITPSLPGKMKKELKTFDIVHAHEYSTYQNITLKKYSKKYGVPYIVQAHGSLVKSDRQLRKKAFDRLFGAGILANASKVIALNPSEVEEYRLAGVPTQKIAIVPNGLDLSDFQALQPKGSFKENFGILINCKFVLYLGRIHKTKGIDLLVEAYSHLIKSMHCQNLMLVIAGPDDGYLSKIKSLVNSLELTNKVIFTGLIAHKDKLSALQDADVLVTPAFSGMPMTFLEACAVGTPVITTTLGDPLNWINGNVGLVTAPNAEDLASAIFRVSYDSDLHRKLSANCKETVNSLFSIEKVVSQLEDIYTSAKKKK